jgi:hypothetical protein
MGKKRKKNTSQKMAECARRENEIKQYGKLVSLRPSKVFGSKKDYKRTKYKYEGEEQN